MLAKIVYSLIVMLFACKEGFCEPISALMAIGAALSSTGAALGPAGVLAAGGLAMSATSMLSSPDKPKDPTAPVVPSQEDAAEKALSKQTSARQAMLLSGGDTMLTGPSGAPLLGVNLKTSNLLGA
jgi:hypothetical protein